MKYLKTYEYRERKDLHPELENGEIVKLDREYIENINPLVNQFAWRDSNGATTRPFTEKEFEREFRLIFFDPHYGYSVKEISPNDNFFGWIPPEYLRSLNQFELDTNKYNL
jgi:hypothetical protein